MLSEMIERFPATSPVAIENFESARAIRLPAEFRQFLLSFNGGRPKENHVRDPEAPHEVLLEVQFFYGIDVPTRIYDLSYMGAFFRIPEGIVLFAVSSTACSYYCFDLRAGKENICFWDQRHHWGTGEWREEDLFVICDRFEEFLEMLQV